MINQGVMRSVGLSVVVLVCCAISVSAQNSSELKAVASVFSIGGGTGQTSTLTVNSTVAQLAIGSGQLAENTVLHGFWPAGGLPGPGSCCGQFTDGFTGNIDCDENGRIDLIDITRLIDHLFIGNPPLCCDEDGNINGSTDGRVTLSDVAQLIDHVYISKAPTAPCL